MIWATTTGQQDVGMLGSTQLDSHANMVVIGDQATIIQTAQQTADVRPFSNECSKLEQVPIVDAAFAYDCPHSGKVYMLVVRNALHINSMGHNLIPPFIMREAGLKVNDVPRIHCGENVSEESHSVISKEPSLKIPLQLDGIFSSFPTRKLTHEEIENCEDMDSIFLTPDSENWDPYNDTYASNEDSFLDFRGELVYDPAPKRRKLFNDDPMMSSIAVSGEIFDATMDDAIDRKNFDLFDCTFVNPRDGDDIFNLDDDSICATVCDISVCFDDELLRRGLNERHAQYRMTEASGSNGLVDLDMTDDLFVSAAHVEMQNGINKEHLSKIWWISEKEAGNTLKVTSQLNKQDADSTISRKFGTNDRMLRYRRINSHFFSDTFYATGSATSIRGYSCMQIFVSDKGFVKVYGMKSPSEFINALKMFCKEVGVPNAFVVDPHRSQKSDEVRQFCHQIGSTLRILEESTQHANRGELYIGLVKEKVRKDMRATNSPVKLWCYATERQAQIFTLSAKDLFQLQGTNPYTATLGDVGDISNLCQFGWYEWVYFREGKASFPYLTEVLGRCLGPTRNEGNEMCQAVLQMNGQILPRRTLRRLTKDELSPSNTVELQKQAAFDEAIRAKLGDSMTVVDKPPESDLPPELQFEEPYEDDDEPTLIIPEADAVDASGKPVNQQSVTDLLINAEVLMPHDEVMCLAKVIRRSIDSDGRITGTFNENSSLNSLVYDVEFPDGAVKQFAANVIAENILTQVDSDGHRSDIMEGIIGHKSDKSALTKETAFVTTSRGMRKLRQTTIGWKFMVQFRNQTTQWVSLKILKESNPVEVAEYVKAHNLEDEPAFAWWVPYTLKKRDRIIAMVNSRVRNRTHKFGIEVPTTPSHAKELDEQNGNTLWQDAEAKEMYQVSVAFKILEDDECLPPGWKKSSGHLIYDIKMDFTRKARWVKDGHLTADPKVTSYAGVVSRESIRIALTYASLLGVDVLAADIRNAYLQAPSSEKHFIICGTEFGLEHKGKRAMIVRALYGGKVAGRDFWLHLRSCMDFLGFQFSKADPDVWFRSAKRSNNDEYYEYVLLYTDDCLVISDRGEDILRKEIGKYFQLKEESIGPPTIYLGGNMRQVTVANGTKAWAFGSAQYVKTAVKNVEDYLHKQGETLPNRVTTPLSNGYRPEIDISEELKPDKASYFQSLIGVLRWMVELGRVDICVEVSMLSSHLALPRKGHLEQVLHMFGYLKVHHNAEMVFDSSIPDIEMEPFVREDWSQSIYGEVAEDLPPNMPEPKGKAFTMRVFVDSDHAGDSVTRRSRTGFIVFLNEAPIYWMSKKQTSCETSTFGAEFIAMKQATEYVRALRYKLRMFGIPCEEPTYIYGDNQSVLSNTTVPASTLKKKSNSIAYHFVREGCARDEWRTTYINTNDNISDLLTKPLPSGEKRWGFIRKILYWL